MPAQLLSQILASSTRLAMPIGVYAGLEITRASVWEAASNPQAQLDSQLAMFERFQIPFFLTAMDLSLEAEAFGCEIMASETEIPTVVGRKVTNSAELDALPTPQPGDARTWVALEAIRRMKASAPAGVPVMAGMIGPFSLAARLFGVSETLKLTATDPGLMTALVQRATDFLTTYACALRDAGADGVIMAEPTAGLISPRGVSKFVSPYVKQMITAAETESFSLILHNCGARLVHLPALLESGASSYHFGQPMDLLAALAQTDRQIVLCGNLDPTSVFYDLAPAEVAQRTRQLLADTAAYANFIISSGCDLPPGTPLASMDAFYAEVAAFNASRG